VDYEFEAACDAQKTRWQGRHKWRTPAAETWLALDGEITGKLADGIVAAIEASPDAPLFLSIDSRGGDAGQALWLYRAIRAHAAPTTAVCNGRCCSAALLPYLAGDRRLAARSARFLVHNGELDAPIRGRMTGANLRNHAAEVEAMDVEFLDITVARCRFWSEWSVRAAHNSETSFDAAAARLRGIVHEIIE
jgi:ATP-dependent protease ClpP protease subunit